MSSDHTTPEGYVKLALAINRHFEGYVDAYFGPREWREEIERIEPDPLPSLTKRADELIDALGPSDGFDKQRRLFLSGQLQAMKTIVQLLMGKEMTVHDEASALYDIEVGWIDEATFHEAHELLDKALPPGRTLHERMDDRRSRLKLEDEQIEPLIMIALEEVQKRTRNLYGLPQGEQVEISFVRNKPWSGYNWYLGNLKSKIEINIDLPVYLYSILDYIAHEAYPGHHTELVTKETALVNGKNRIEHCVVPLNVPSATVSEGIATQARLALAPYEKWDEWSAEVLQPAAGMTDLSPENLKLMRKANRKLAGVFHNAILLLHEREKSEAEVARYLIEHGLYSEEQAQSSVRFAMTPEFRTYGFIYAYGRDLVDQLFESGDNKVHVFERLLSEPVTPSLIRSWIGSENKKYRTEKPQ